MDTIFALSSGRGRAAVAVIRVSGPAALDALAAMVKRVPADRHAAPCRLFHPTDGYELDQALVLRFDAPRSETGEMMVELQVHGGRAVIEAVLAALGSIEGLRPAEAGEFARRAFANGKMDLTTAEGIADLVDAETEAQRRQAVRQSGGALARLYDGWRGRLIEAQALVEAAIDFSDEGDVGTAAFDQGRQRADALATELAAHLATAHRGEILHDGFRVVIAGPPNAGKSSLLNALVRREAAIVSDEAGTTRDLIEVRLDLGGVPVILTDTAGLRTQPTGAVESEGMRRAVERARSADLVIWLISPDTTPAIGSGPAALGLAPDTPVLTVMNKLDLADATSASVVPADLHISIRDGRGLDQLLARLASAAEAAAGDGCELVPTSARHRRHLDRASRALAAFLAGDSADAELRAEDLRTAATELGRLTGRIDPEDVLDQVFGRFCIGK